MRLSLCISTQIRRSFPQFPSPCGRARPLATGRQRSPPKRSGFMLWTPDEDAWSCPELNRGASGFNRQLYRLSYRTVWVAGFEPTTSPVRGERPTKLAYTQSHCPQCSTSIGVAANALMVPHIRISRPVTRSVNNASIRFPLRGRLQRL